MQGEALKMTTAIQLIRPPVIFPSGRIGSVTGTPPIGLAYIAAFLRNNNIDVSVIDAFGERPTHCTIINNFEVYGLTIDEIIERLTRAKQIIGISCMFSNEFFYVRQLIERIKEKIEDSIIVIGGEHATALANYCLESCNNIDYVVLGEGEVVFYRLINALLHDTEEIDSIPNIAYRKNNQIIINQEGVTSINASRIKEIDNLPYPAWDMIPVENYLKNGISTISCSGKRIMPILASRGCPYSCKFCSNNQMWGSKYYSRDYTDVIKEIKKYKIEYQITGFEFHDLTLIMNKEYIKEFCKLLIEEKLNIEWNIPATRSELIDNEVIDLLKESGCSNITLTPDSGSKETLDDIRKRVNINKITQCVKFFVDSGIITKVNLVIGFPNEKHQDILRTLFYGLKLAAIGAESVLFYRFVPYPGSEFFNLLVRQGIIDIHDSKFDDFLAKNVYNELSKIHSFSNRVSNAAMRNYLIIGYSLCHLVYFIANPSKAYNILNNVFKKQPKSNKDILFINLIERVKKEIYGFISNKK